LEALELAAHDGRLERLEGFGPRRAQIGAHRARGTIGPPAIPSDAPEPEPPTSFGSPRHRP
jgi:hypothetical protein